MNTNTTVSLFVLLLAGLIGWFVISLRQPPKTTSPTIEFLEKGLKKDKLTGLEISTGERKVSFERGTDQDEWSLPGKWPVRDKEFAALLTTLTQLHSRFVAEPLKDEADLANYGLDANTLTIKVTADDAEHMLLLGEGPGEGNRFVRPTFLRLDKQMEVVRLAPGLIAQLGQGQEYYQQRRLFPSKRVPKEPDSTEKIELLDALNLSVSAGANKFTLTHTPNPSPSGRGVRGVGDDWQLTAPVIDRTDPEPLRTVLTAVPDLWAERFVDARGKKLEDFGLAKPKYEVAVTRDSGAVVKLLAGTQARVETRLVAKAPPPPMFPGQPPQKDTEEVHEEYSYAKLQDNDQIFEVKTATLKTIAGPWSNLRNPLLAKFKPDDVQRIEIVSEALTKQVIVLVKTTAKDKSGWRLEKPAAYDAQSGQVDELLTKLAGLQTKEFIDKADPALGLDKPAAVVKVVVNQPGAQATGLATKPSPKIETFTYRLTTSDKDKEKGKLFVQVEGWPRINVLDDSLLKLVQRPALAYRERRLLDVKEADLARIDIQRRDGNALSLAQDKTGWKLVAPVASPIDAGKVKSLTAALAHLEAVDFVSDRPKADELAKVFGLEKPSVRATFQVGTAAKAQHVLAIGGQRAGSKDEFYARLDQGPVFVVRKDLVDDLNRDSLAYHSNELWKLNPAEMTEIDVNRDGSSYRLQRMDKAWKIVAPFSATPVADQADALATALAHLQTENFVRLDASPSPLVLAVYGLAQPSMRVRVTAAGKAHTLLLGKAHDKGRFARIEGGDGIFLIDSTLDAELERPVFDLLDNLVLSFDRDTMVGMIRKMPGDDCELVKKGEDWTVRLQTVANASGSDRPADAVIMGDLLDRLFRLRGQRVAGYMAKDLAPFGLDQPAATVVIKLDNGTGKKSEHVIKLGKKDADVFAAVDKGETVVVLAPKLADVLLAPAINFADHDLTHLSGVDRVTLQRDGRRVVFARIATGWAMTDPVKASAESDELDKLVKELSQLRPDKLLAEKVNPKEWGLEKPVVECKLAKEGKDVLDIAIGDAEPSPLTPLPQGEGLGVRGSRRFARLAGKDLVFLLSPALSTRIQQEFRDRKVWETFDTAQVKLVAFKGPEQSFTLVAAPGAKNKWLVKDKFDVAVNGDAVTDTLDALARLKVERYVEDTKANLQRYGLTPPTLRVEVDTPSGPRTLLIGRAEGTSQRHYANVPGSEGVFLISEADSRRIVRGLADFTSKEKK